ncbi:hypothetical protein [uncultured Dialister sp.]|uniref:hypothetical protein n=1 Tax=uncultured Dialister sp. TaxID=278064 RepID=UPI00345B94A5
MSKSRLSFTVSARKSERRLSHFTIREASSSRKWTYFRMRLFLAFRSAAAGSPLSRSMAVTALSMGTAGMVKLRQARG